MSDIPKGCQTCRFRRGGDPNFWRCGRAGGIYCSTVVAYDKWPGCPNFVGWEPRRSLRRWVFEMIWR